MLIVGLNPGEQPTNWVRHEGPTEESAEYDWLEVSGRSTASSNWMKKVEYFCGGGHAMMSEFFFWSSQNSGEAFKSRFGTALWKSPHLAFCRAMNMRLVDVLKPSVVVCPGISGADFFSGFYGLKRAAPPVVDGNHRLVEHFEDGGTPWLFTKHWTGSHGFSGQQKAIVRDYVAAQMAAAN